jgi:hypothetical protein
MQMIRVSLSWLLIAASPCFCAAQSLHWQLDEGGGYSIGDGALNCSGTLGDGGTGNLHTGAGADRGGRYLERSVNLDRRGVPLTAAIRVYDDKPLALFSLTYQGAAAQPVLAFPDFASVPAGCHVFSYKNQAFAPPAFDGEPGSTPWLIFDDRDDAAIIAAASHFCIQQMGRDPTRISCELNERLKNIPAGFTQNTWVVIGKGINHVWDAWGAAMTDLAGKTRPASDADIGLKYLGYWTDNGAFYYYNYDPSLGYAKTLLKLADHFHQRKIPVGYLQLDSWWYHKSLAGADGKIGKTKNSKLPTGEWNRYGGLLDYTADRAVFPDGLASFQRLLNLPLITHNRWIDRGSPYHRQYQISGVAALDPKWWQDIADYLQSSGVVGYEQDWLSTIYKYTPELSATPDAADVFLDGMADACRVDGLTIQYCMPLPCCFLQGSRYNNLTTIRTSDDRFGRNRWHNFLFTSRLASALGIWPWSDVYMSGEYYNVLLSDLSGGMVGFGDEMGNENRAVLLHAVRDDGVIVKPDATLTPTDSSFLAEARHLAGPLVASTYTDHAGVRTGYVFAFVDSESAEPSIHFSPEEIGFTGPSYVYDYFANRAARVEAGGTLDSHLDSDGVGYFVLSQPGRSGIAFMGDMGKYVGTGKQRVAAIHDEPAHLTAQIVFAAVERMVRLHGCCAAAPLVAVVGGRAGPVAYDPASQHFTVDIIADPGSQIRTADVTIRRK